MNTNLFFQKEFQKKETELRTALVEIAQNRSMIEKLNNAIRLLQSEQPDVAKLNAANESDRIAAQKATAQNNKLKNEIENLQEAYNKMVCFEIIVFVMLNNSDILIYNVMHSMYFHLYYLLF